MNSSKECVTLSYHPELRSSTEVAKYSKIRLCVHSAVRAEGCRNCGPKKALHLFEIRFRSLAFFGCNCERRQLVRGAVVIAANPPQERRDVVQRKSLASPPWSLTATSAVHVSTGYSDASVRGLNCSYVLTSSFLDSIVGLIHKIVSAASPSCTRYNSNCYAFCFLVFASGNCIVH